MKSRLVFLWVILFLLLSIGNIIQAETGHTHSAPTLTERGNQTVNVNVHIGVGIHVLSNGCSSVNKWWSTGKGSLNDIGFPSSNTWQWEPGPNDIGTHPIKVCVSNEHDRSTCIEWNVTVKNRPPIFNKISNRTTYQERTVKFKISASDPDGHNITYSKISGPGYFNSYTRQFSWTPNHSAVGDSEESRRHKITFRACDAYDCVTRDAYITVRNTEVVDEGDRIILEAIGDDVDPEDTRWNMDYSMSGPFSRHFDTRSHKFDWTPHYQNAGLYKVNFTVEDHGGKKDTLSRWIDVRSVYKEKNLNEPMPPNYKPYPRLPSHPGSRTVFPTRPILEYAPDAPTIDHTLICNVSECPDSGQNYIQLPTLPDDPYDSEPVAPTRDPDTADKYRPREVLTQVPTNDGETNVNVYNNKNFLANTEAYEEYKGEMESWQVKVLDYEEALSIFEITQENNYEKYIDYTTKVNNYNDYVANVWESYTNEYEQAEDGYELWLAQRANYLDTVEKIKRIEKENNKKRDHYFNVTLKDFYNDTVPYYKERYDKVNVIEAKDKEPPKTPNYTSIDGPYSSIPSYHNQPSDIEIVEPDDPLLIGEETIPTFEERFLE
ncbi:MAG: hypothetical protein ACOCQR_00295 [bacterium]